MEWMKASDRLPEDARDVIIARENWVDVGYWCQVDKKWRFNHMGTPHVASVTHWMELPEPPKGEDE